MIIDSIRCIRQIPLRLGAWLSGYTLAPAPEVEAFFKREAELQEELRDDGILDNARDFEDLLYREYQDDHPGGDPSIKSEEAYPDW